MFNCWGNCFLSFELLKLTNLCLKKNYDSTIDSNGFKNERKMAMRAS